MFRAKAGGFKRVKTLRQADDNAFFDAEGMALGHEGGRRWVQQRIDSGPKCRKYALQHIRRHGAEGHVVQDPAESQVRPVVRMKAL